MYGNLAPEGQSFANRILQFLILTVTIFLLGSVAKITGKEGLIFEGTAKVYDSEELMMAGLNRKEITKGKSFI